MLDFMEGQKILQQRIAELNAALKKHPSAMQWEFCTAEAGESYPPESGYIPVQATFFKAEPTQDIWLRTAYLPPAEIAGLSVQNSRFYLTANTVINPVDVYINGKITMSFSYWADFTRPEILLEKSESGTVYQIDICLRQCHTLSSQGINFLPWFDIEAVDNLLFLMTALAEELNYLAAIPEAEEILQQADSCLLCQAEVCPFEQMGALIEKVHDILEPIRSVAKQHTVYLISHAHIDIDWQWDRNDTYNVCSNDFSTMTALMEEFPDFTYSQSQPCLYQFIKDRKPKLFEEIRNRVQKGQWDVSNAVRWTESDLNMPEGESIAHGILYGSRFIKEEFGKYPTVCHEPDAFGHPETMPRILQKSGVNYYFHMRGNAEHILHRWSGTGDYRLLAVADQYKGVLSISRLIANVLRYKKEHGLNFSMFMFGVGDHGGGPSKRDIQKLQIMDMMPGMPKLLHSSMEAFFEAVSRAYKPNFLPELRGELGPVFEGCYTSHSDIKLWHRRLESLLLQTELLQAEEKNAGKNFDAEMLEKTWKKLLTLQFHDTICGCSIAETYQRACLEVKESCDTLTAYLRKHLSVSDHVFDDQITIVNLLPFARTEPVFLKEKGSMQLQTLSGKTMMTQSVNGDLLFVPDIIPAGGSVSYRLVHRSESTESEKGSEMPQNGYFETDFFSIRIDPETGIIERMTDKQTGKKYIYSRDFTPEPMNGYPFHFDNNLFSVDYEKPHHRRSAWIIGPVYRRESLFDGKVEMVSSGEVADILKIQRSVGKSTITQQVVIYKHLPRIDFNQTVDWQEQSTHDTLAPMLLMHFHPELNGNITASREIPFGVAKTAPNGETHSCLRWADVSDETLGFTVVNDSKYGCAINGDTLTMHCIRTSFHPDPAPDRCVHHFRFALYPHIGGCNDTEASRLGKSFNSFPVVLYGRKVEELKLPVVALDDNVIISTIKPAYQEQGYIIRLFTSNQHSTAFRLQAAAPVYIAEEVMITEDRPFKRNLLVDGNEIRGMLHAGEILTLHIILGA